MPRPPTPAIITSSTGETFDYPSMKDARAALKTLIKGAKGTNTTFNVAEAPKS